MAGHAAAGNPLGLVNLSKPKLSDTDATWTQPTLYVTPYVYLTGTASDMSAAWIPWVSQTGRCSLGDDGHLRHRRQDDQDVGIDRLAQRAGPDESHRHAARLGKQQLLQRTDGGGRRGRRTDMPRFPQPS